MRREALATDRGTPGATAKLTPNTQDELTQIKKRAELALGWADEGVCPYASI